MAVIKMWPLAWRKKNMQTSLQLHGFCYLYVLCILYCLLCVLYLIHLMYKLLANRCVANKQ